MPDLKMITPEKSEKTDLFCHRLFIPIPFAEQVAPPLPNMPAQMRPAGEIRFVGCLKNQCAIYDRVHARCGDLSQSIALQELSDQMKKELDRRANETVVSIDGGV